MKSLFSFAFVVTVALLTGALAVADLSTRRVPEPLALPLTKIDSAIAGWTETGEHQLPPGSLKALSPTEYLSRTYRKDGIPLDLFIAFYARQRAGESMHSPKHCLPGAGWEIWRHDSAIVPVNGHQYQMNRDSIENAGNRMLMFYWYQSRDRIVANEYLGKVLLARDTLLTGHTAGSIVRITLPDTPGAAQEGVFFASKIIPEVARCFGQDSPGAK